MIVIRSIIFNIVFYLVLFVYLIAAMPTLLMPRQALLAMVKNWSRLNLWLLKVICNIGYEFRGLERVPPGAALIASKHQSMWETFALVPMLKDPAFILKRELLWIPFFGWCAAKAEMIPVDRGRRSQALAAMTARAKAEAARLCGLARSPFVATKTRLRSKTIAHIRATLADDMKSLMTSA